jgi:hypothetical protein
LSRADTDGLSIRYITNRVGLRELERDPGDEHIANCRLGEIPAVRDYVCEIVTPHCPVISSLFHAYTKDLTCLGHLRLIGWVNLKDRILTLFLFLQNLQGFRIVGGRNHAI